jgi:hypothetical protein
VVAIVVALLVAAGGIYAVTRAFDRDTRRSPAADLTPSATSEPSPIKTPSESPSPAPDWAQSGVFGAMYDTITSGSPAGWNFDLTHDRLDGDWRIDGNVDDGAGPGRLYVDVTTRPGNLEADPCSDPEFTQGARCYRVPQPNGDLLVLRDIVTDPGGTKTIEVVLIHPDRSGISAEAGNFRAPVLPEPGHPSSSEVTRDQPLYEVGQLGKLVLALDHAVQDCLRTSC